MKFYKSTVCLIKPLDSIEEPRQRKSGPNQLKVLTKGQSLLSPGKQVGGACQPETA